MPPPNVSTTSAIKTVVSKLGSIHDAALPPGDNIDFANVKNTNWQCRTWVIKTAILKHNADTNQTKNKPTKLATNHVNKCGEFTNSHCNKNSHINQ